MLASDRGTFFVSFSDDYDDDETVGTIPVTRLCSLRIIKSGLMVQSWTRDFECACHIHNHDRTALVGVLSVAAAHLSTCASLSVNIAACYKT